MGLARNESITRYMPLADRLAIEGELFGATGVVSNGTLSQGLSIAALQLPSFTRAVWIEAVTLTANRECIIALNIGDSSQSGGQQTIRAIVGPGRAVSIPIRGLVHVNQAAPNSVFFSASVNTVLDGTTTGFYATAGFTGWSVYDDFAINASRVGLVISDSILNGGVAKASSMEWRVRSHLVGGGADLRLINKSMSGATTSFHEARRTVGAYDFPQLDFIHYQLGTNDAGQSVAASTAKSNLENLIQWKQARYADAELVVFGATPRQNNTYETNLIAIRSAQQDAVAEADDPKVHYCSLAAAFDRTVEANYLASDSSGDKVHPNATSHGAAAGIATAFLDAQGVTLAA